MRRLFVASLLAAVALAACSDAIPAGASMTFTNPVYDKNFPDPGVLHEGGTVAPHPAERAETPATRTVIFPSVCSQISGPVVR